VEVGKGISQSEISQKLIDKGWQLSVVEEAFSALGNTPEDALSAYQNPSRSEAYTSGDDPVVKWIKEDTLLKVGALFFLIGFAWLLTYAFMNNWIGPVGRITLGMFAGASFMAFGWAYMKKSIEKGSVFLVLGNTILMFTILAARTYYDFFTPLSALTLVFLGSLFVSVTSVVFKQRTLSVVGAVMAYAAPLFVGGDGEYIGLLSYLLVVVVSSIFVSAYVGKKEVLLVSIAASWIYSLPYLIGSIIADRGAVLLFSYLFTVIFFIATMVYALRGDADETPALTVSSVLTSAFLTAWVLVAAGKEWQSLILTAWAIVFMLSAFIVSRKIGQKELFFTYACIGIGLIGLSTALELDGIILAVVYTIESLVLTFATFMVLPEKKHSVKSALTLILPAALSLSSVFSRNWHTGFFHKDFAILSFVGVAFFVVGVVLYRFFARTEDVESKGIASGFMVAGSVYAYGILWLSLHAELPQGMAIAFSLIIYLLIGLFFYFRNASPLAKTYGGVMVGGVIARLLVVDVWNMDLAPRIITFFVVGALLMSTAFLNKKQSPLISRDI
jgi:hypothetical protein